MRLSLPKPESVKHAVVRLAVLKQQCAVLRVVDLETWRGLKKVEADLEKEKKNGSRQEI